MVALATWYEIVGVGSLTFYGWDEIDPSGMKHRLPQLYVTRTLS